MFWNSLLATIRVVGPRVVCVCVIISKMVDVVISNKVCTLKDVVQLNSPLPPSPINPDPSALPPPLPFRPRYRFISFKAVLRPYGT